MKSLEDMYKEIYKDNPQGYEEHLKEQEVRRLKMREQDRLSRVKVAAIFKQTDEEQTTRYVNELRERDLMDHSFQIYRMMQTLNRAYAKVVDSGDSTSSQIIQAATSSRKPKMDINENLVSLMESPGEKEIEVAVDKLTPEEMEAYVQSLRKQYEKVNERYDELMNEFVFFVSQTNLKQLVMRHSWEDVQSTLFNLFPDQAKLVEGYQHVYGELKRLIPQKNEENLVIEINADGKGYFDVCGIKPTEKVSYAIEFCPWQEWLGFYVSQRDLDKHGELFCLAHCLWEMTFTGFTQATIQDNMDEILDRVSDAEEMIKERKEKSGEKE